SRPCASWAHATASRANGSCSTRGVALSRQPVAKVERTIDPPGRGPMPRIAAYTHVPVACDDRRHAGGIARFDIAEIVADVNARRRCDLEMAGRMQERRRMRLRVRRRIAGNHD